MARNTDKSDDAKICRYDHNRRARIIKAQCWKYNSIKNGKITDDEFYVFFIQE